ncbi:hypothetical protein AAVH_38116 [Aphelenchoides avenae]|nr:hypothetical protein AAVH_38116 [Aphelenchus avenae]
MCAVSTRLEALLAAACGTYPFRRLRRVDLKYYQGEDDVSKFEVSILDHGDELAFLVCETLDEALTFLAPFYRRTYVDELFEVYLGLSGESYRVPPRQWSVLTQIFRSGAARHLQFWSTDLSLLDDNAFVDAVRCGRLEVNDCDSQGRLLSDDLLRSCAANGVIELEMWGFLAEEEYAVSEDALLEYCFPPSGPSRFLEVNNLAVSDTFAAKFFERLLAPGRTSGPRGFLKFVGTKEQRDLAAYAQHLVRLTVSLG